MHNANVSQDAVMNMNNYLRQTNQQYHSSNVSEQKDSHNQLDNPTKDVLKQLNLKSRKPQPKLTKPNAARYYCLVKECSCSYSTKWDLMKHHSKKHLD